MRGVLVIIGDAGEVQEIAILATDDAEEAVVRRALTKWQRMAQAECETTPIAPEQAVSLPDRQEAGCPQSYSMIVPRTSSQRPRRRSGQSRIEEKAMTREDRIQTIRILGHGILELAEQPELDPEDAIERILTFVLLMYPGMKAALQKGRRKTTVAEAIAVLVLERAEAAEKAWRALPKAGREAIIGGQN
jgi:hypothetical protein